MNYSGIFISWTPKDSRVEAVAKLLNLEPIYIYNSGNVFKKNIDRIVQTINILRDNKAANVFITNNIFLPAIIAVVFKYFYNFNLYLDTHSAPFNKKNSLSYPFFIHKLIVKINKVYSIVHTPGNFNVVQSWGADAFLLTDPPYSHILCEKLDDYPLEKGVKIVFICTYAFDEPYLEAIKAFENIDYCTFYITGKAIRKFSDKKNIIQTGYLDRSIYLHLLKNADICMTLTKRENTMQCGGNEALSMKKPLILSDTSFLRSYFYKGAIHVNNDSESIEKGVKLAIEQRKELEFEIKELLKERTIDAITAIENIKSTFKI